MAWHGIFGHDEVVEQFDRALARGRLASSFLFVGPAGIGKRLFAIKLAQAFLCRARPETALDPCEVCPACLQVRAATHPDFQYVCKPDDKSFLPLELLIGDKEHRRREGLCHDIALTPLMGGRKVAIIDDADYLNAEGANSLLKTLEEPPPQSVLILIGTTPAKQLPTIRSRCQLIRFRPLPPEVVAEVLVSEGLIEDPAEAQRLALASGGSVQRARELADPGLSTARSSLSQRLAEPRLDSVGLAAELLGFLDQSGTEAAARRERLRQLAMLAGNFFSSLLRRLTGAPAAGNAEIDFWVENALKVWPGDAETAALCAERCLEAAQQIDRNVHPTTLLECWLDDLARTSAPVSARR